MKCSLGISNFLEKISSLSHSIVFLYFFALIAEEGFLIDPCYSLEPYIHMFISFLFSFPFCFSLFTGICPITSWQIDGETMETVIDFIFLGPNITTDGDFSHEIKRCLLLGSKAMTNLDSILKSRDITLPAKVHLVKAISGSHVWMLELGTIKKLSAKELMLLNCVGEDSWEFLGLQRDQISQL